MLCNFYNGTKHSCIYGNLCYYIHSNNGEHRRDNIIISYFACINNVIIFKSLYRQHINNKLQIRMSNLNSIYENTIKLAGNTETYLLMIIDNLHNYTRLTDIAKNIGFLNIEQMIETVIPRLYINTDPLLWIEQHISNMDNKTLVMSFIVSIISFRPIPHIGVLQINPIIRQGGCFLFNNKPWKVLMYNLFKTINIQYLINHIINQFPTNLFYESYNNINSKYTTESYCHLLRIIHITMTKIFYKLINTFICNPILFIKLAYQTDDGLIITKDDATIISKLIPLVMIPSLTILFSKCQLIINGKYQNLGFVWNYNDFSPQENISINSWFMLYYYVVMRNSIENNYGDIDYNIHNMSYPKNSYIISHIAESIYTASKQTNKFVFTHSKFRKFIRSLFENRTHMAQHDKPHESLCRTIIMFIKYYNNEPYNNIHWLCVESEFITGKINYDTICTKYGNMNISKEAKNKLFQSLYNQIKGYQYYMVDTYIKEESPCCVLYKKAQMNIMKQLENIIIQIFPTYQVSTRA